MKTNQVKVILKILRLGINLSDFDLIDKPSESAIKHAMQYLH